jgi:hypothetical protein
MSWKQFASNLKSYFRKEQSKGVYVKKEPGTSQEVKLIASMAQSEAIKQTILLNPWSYPADRPTIKESTDGTPGILVTFRAIGQQGIDEIKLALLAEYPNK